ncbi:reverse transcriptase domain-containing protein [Tanacetum coccineum]
MSTPDYIYPIIVPSDFDVEDAFSSTNTPDYTSASPNYSPALSRNTSPDPSDDLTNNESPIPLPQVPTVPPTVLPPSQVLPLSSMFESRNFFLPKEILPPKKRARSRSSSSTSALSQLPLERIGHIEDKIEGLGNGRVIIQQDFDQLETELHEARAQIAGFQREQIRHDDKIVLASVRMTPKRTSTSAAPAMTQAAIRKLVADSTEGVVGLIRWFERTESVFLRNNCTEDCKVKFATGTLTEEALSWWNSFAQSIRIEEAYKITWTKFKNLLIKKYCPRTEINKMEDEFYNLTVKGNDLKTYVRRF